LCYIWQVSDRRAFIWCSQDPGFGVRLSASGTRTFVVQRRVGGLLHPHSTGAQHAQTHQPSCRSCGASSLGSIGRERRISIGRRGVFTVGAVPSWRIEPGQSKTRSGRVLPLSTQAVAILRALPRLKANPYVFSSRDGTSHTIHPEATWREVSRAAGIHVTAHSMRRTFTNICLKLGVEMWKTEMLTSHVPTTTTLLHYTDTADLRETCAPDVQHVGNWIEDQAKTAGHAA